MTPAAIEPATFNRNEHQEYFLGVKAASTLGWQP